MESILFMFRRRSVSWKGYDYTRPGAYFVTLCTQDQVCLFGEVVGGRMERNACGEAARAEWLRTSIIRPDVRVSDDEFVVMPNHLHGILWILDQEAADSCSPAPDGRLPRGPGSRSLGAIVGQFKSASTRAVRAIHGNPRTQVWQRNYHEHVIRDQRSLDRIRAYIAANPAHWGTDRENPEAPDDRPDHPWRALR